MKRLLWLVCALALVSANTALGSPRSRTLPPGWNMVSFPGVPENVDPAVVLSEIPLSGCLYRYDPGILGYVAYNDFDSIPFGSLQANQGYWLYVDQTTSIDAPVTQPPGATNITLPTASWYMLGNGFDHPTWWADCQVTNGGQTKSVADAILAGWIDASTYRYDPRLWAYADGNDTLRPWLGYWFRTQLPNLTLTIPSSRLEQSSYVTSLLNSMTLAEKIGQIIMDRFSGTTGSTAEVEIRDKMVGGEVYFAANFTSPTQAATLSNTLQGYSQQTRLKIPLLLAMDQEGGRVTRLAGGTDFPGGMALGAAGSAQDSYSAGSIFGEEIKAVGNTVDLAPVVDVNNNPLNPVIGVRSFGEVTSAVSALARSYVSGLQDSDAIATAKHFPGHGDTAVDSHSGLPVVTYDRATLDAVHLPPFAAAIDAGLDMVMSAHILVTAVDPVYPATLSPAILTGILRGDLGFEGCIITDSLGMGALRGTFTDYEIAWRAVKAGADILLPFDDTDRDVCIDALTTEVGNGNIPMSRIDDAVRHILALKLKMGLFTDPLVDPVEAPNVVGIPAHKAEELRIAKEAVTLLRNTGVLPLAAASPDKLFLVVVSTSGETTTDCYTRFGNFIKAKHSNTDVMSCNASPTTTQINTIVAAAQTANKIIVGTSRAQLAANVGQLNLVAALQQQTGKPVIVVGMREPYDAGIAPIPSANAFLTGYGYKDCSLQALTDVLFGDYNPVVGHLPVRITDGVSVPEVIVYPVGSGLHY